MNMGVLSMMTHVDTMTNCLALELAVITLMKSCHVVTRALNFGVLPN